MVAQRYRLRHLGHVLPAHQLRTHSRQFALLPLGMAQKQCLSHHQAQDSITEKFKSFIVHGGCGRIYADRLNLLIGQRPVGQRAHQQLSLGKAMSKRSFQFSQNCFHLLLWGCNFEEALPGYRDSRALGQG